MRNALPATPDGLARSGVTCQACGHVVVTSIQGLYDNPAVGSPQRFCSPACRQAAWRRRRAGVAEDAPASTGADVAASSPTRQATNHHDQSRGQFSAVAKGSVFGRR